MAEALDIRALRHHDIGQVIALWREAGFLRAGPDGLTVDEALDTMLTEGVVCLVAASREGIVGSAFALVAGALGAALVGRTLPPTVTGPSAVERLGGRMVDPALWDSLRRMERDKEITDEDVDTATYARY